MATKRRKRPTYDDQFRASAVVMLESQGYPGTPGALTAVAKHLKVPERTLSRWFNKEQNPPPDHLVKEKRGDLVEGIRDEIEAILLQMKSERVNAEYKDLGWTFAVFVDKLQLLTGKATERAEVNVNDSRERLAHLVDRFATRSGTAKPADEIKQ